MRNPGVLLNNLFFFFGIYISIYMRSQLALHELNIFSGCTDWVKLVWFSGIMLTLKLTLILQLTVKTALISHSKTIFVWGEAHLYSFEAVTTAVTEAVGDGLAFKMKAEVVSGARRSFTDHRPDGETERLIQSRAELCSPPHSCNTQDLFLPELKRWADPIDTHIPQSQSDIMGSISNSFQQFHQQASLHTQHRCQFGEILLVYRSLCFVMLHLRSIKSIKHISTVWHRYVMPSLTDCDSSQDSLTADG